MDWARCISNIERSGMSLTQIARRIGLSLSAVSDIKHGRTKAPNGSAALVPARLHCERLGAASQEVTRCARTLRR